MQGTEGARFHPELYLPAQENILSKGCIYWSVVNDSQFHLWTLTLIVLNVTRSFAAANWFSASVRWSSGCSLKASVGRVGEDGQPGLKLGIALGAPRLREPGMLADDGQRALVCLKIGLRFCSCAMPEGRSASPIRMLFLRCLRDSS